MKKVYFILLTAILVLLTGCGGNSTNKLFISSNASSITTGTTLENTTTTTSTDLADDIDYMLQISYGMERIYWDNPVDRYWLARWRGSQAEIRSVQDAYLGAWKEEYENILNYIEETAEYEVSKEGIINYKKGVDFQIENLNEVLVPDRNMWGNGTFSWLNEEKARIYKTAAIILIDRLIDKNDGEEPYYHTNYYQWLDHDYYHESTTPTVSTTQP